MDINTYRDKLKGAIIGRFAGCALGAPVELIELDKLIAFCKKTNQTFPPTNYFEQAPDPDSERYMFGKGRDFTKSEMSFLSTDDDITYTLLSLMMMEEHSNNLTTSHVAEYWQKYLPMKCTFTAERTALKNLNNNVDPLEAAIINNTESDFIGAAIRIDGYAYVHPSDPKAAVELAYQDAYLSHRDSGLNSALYFTALIALAFTSNDIDQTMNDALKFVPTDSEFHKEMSWALSIKESVTDYYNANRLVTERYPNMSPIHAINNACLTVWGIHIGKDDYTRGISQTVAMAYDNDCTAATVGSVLGAYLGIDAIDEKWYKPWNNKLLSYLNGIESFELDDVVNRFYKIGINNIKT